MNLCKQGYTETTRGNEEEDDDVGDGGGGVGGGDGTTRTRGRVKEESNRERRQGARRRECKTCVSWRQRAAGLTQGVVKLNKGLKGRP